jgi:hypothetical protein
VCFQVSRVDHDRLGRGARGSQPLHHADEDTPFVPPLPTVVERLVGAILPRRIAPTQSVAVDENDTAQHPPVINPWLAVALCEYGSSRAICSTVSQYRSLILGLLAEPESDRASQINGS